MARQHFRGFAHVQTANGIGQAELQPDARFEIGRAERGERADFLPEGFGASEASKFFRRALLKEQRHLRHALRSANNEN